MGLVRALTPPVVATTQAAPVIQQNRSLGEFGNQFALSGGAWANCSYAQALENPALYRGVSFLAGQIGKAPLHGYRDQQSGPALKLVPTPPMLETPAAGFDTRITVLRAWTMDYLLDGNAIGIVASRNAEGWPTAFIPVPASLVNVRWVDPASEYGVLGLGVMVEYEIGGRRYAPWDILHVKNICAPGALRGIGVLEAASKVVNHSRDLQTQASNISANGVPTGLLKSVAGGAVESPEEMALAKQQFLDAQAAGPTIQALAPGMDFIPLSWNPEQLQLIEARNYSDKQIANLFGLPVRYVNGEIGGMNYSSPTLDSVQVLNDTIDPIFVAFEQALSSHMPRGNWARFNRNAVLATDTKTRYETYEIGKRTGWLQNSEIRELEDLPEIPGIDDEPAPPASTPVTTDVPEIPVANSPEEGGN